jgi:ammonium transporter
VAYQMMFAVITPALATGAVADRMKFAGWAVLLALWSVIVYAPIAHWLWAPAGWLTQNGAQDWAGGMVVHASAGAAALALLVVLGRRRAWPENAPLPHSIPLVIIGAGILWFGWFGFNAGDGLQANGVAAQALVNTHVAGAAAMLVWLLLEHLREGHPTVLGGVTGAVAGLATITPCAGYVTTLSAIIIGAVAAVVCHAALRAKVYFRYDDALDVIAVHFVGGVLGSLLLGLFGKEAINSIGADGLFYGGGFTLLGWQVVALVAVITFSFVLTWLIAMGVEKTIGLRVSREDEGALDARQQGMDAYHFSHLLELGHGSSQEDVQEPALASRAGVAPRGSGGADTLVTAVIDLESTDIVELRRALLASDARTIILSEAHVLSAATKEVTIRNGVRSTNVVQQLRVEVLVPRDRADETRSVIEEQTTGAPHSFTLDVMRRG